MLIKGVALGALIIGCCFGCTGDPVAKPAVSNATSSTPTTPAAPAPTAPRCVEDADAEPVAHQFTVSWLIFSGRRDPSWRLTPAQSRELRARILRTHGSARGLDEMTGQLGSMGYIVKASGSQDGFLARAGLERDFWVPRGAVGTFLASTMPCSAFG